MPRWLRVVLDVVFPASCEACDHTLPLAAPGWFCARCRDAMSPPPPPLCSVCGAPLDPTAVTSCCAGCHHRRPAFASARAAALYLPAAAGLNPLATAVQRLKYQRRRGIADALGALLAERYPFADDALLVPVPLHPQRLRTRGFNQALLLARTLGRERRLTVAAAALTRARPTRAQPGLGAAARRRNLEAAFRVPQPATVAGRRIVLVDDVLTTGATADACARALAGAGADRVDVYTVGRAP